MSQMNKKKSLCANPSCNKESKFRCSRCQAVSYCSRDCQAISWKAGHRQECGHLQTKKIDKDLKKADKSSLDAIAMQYNDMADASAAMMATAWRHNASLEKDPRKKKIMLGLAKKMDETVEEEKEKKRQGKIDTTWIHDKEEVKRRNAAADRIRKENDAKFPKNRERRTQQTMDMFEEFGFAEMLKKQQEGGPDLRTQFREQEERRQANEEPQARNVRIVVAYMNLFNPKRDQEESSKSFNEMISKIEAVVTCLSSMLYEFGDALSEQASVSQTKLSKLTSSVSKWKSIPAEERASYSRANLNKVEAKWRKQVSDIFMCVSTGAMATVAKGPTGKGY